MTLSALSLPALPRPVSSRARGFTLLELLVATSLLAVLGLAIGETLRAARDAEKRVLARAERRAQDRVALERIARDLRALVPPGGVYASGLVGERIDRTSGRDALSSVEEETRALSALAGLAAAPPFAARDRVTISVLPGARRFGSTAPAGSGAMASVVWEVDDDPLTPERGLVRRPTTIRDPLPGAASEPVEVVGPTVCGLALRYWDGTQWQDTWDSSAQDLIPAAIEVVLAMRDADGEIRRLSTVVAPLAGRPTALVEATK